MSLCFLLLLNNLFAQVGIGTDTPNSKSVLHLESQAGTKGVILPQITDEQQNALLSELGIDDKGLSFFNTDSSCLLIWQGSQFNSMCEPTKAEFTINCDPTISSIQGTYRQDMLVSNNEFAQLSLTVTKEGPYDISGVSGNGFYFSASGYLGVGEITLMVPAYAIPKFPVAEQFVVFKDNLAGLDLCKLSTEVGPGGGAGDILCDDINPVDMIVGQEPISKLKINVNVTRTGPIRLITDTQNDVYFEGSANFSTLGVNIIELEPMGIPAVVGEFTYTLIIEEGTYNFSTASCPVIINVIDDLAQIDTNSNPTLNVDGVYVETVPLNNSHKIRASEISFNTGGSYSLGIRYVDGGDGDPGLVFKNVQGVMSASGSITNIEFLGEIGIKPHISGTFQYEIYDIYTASSIGNPVNIVIQAMKGTFENPAISCNDIFNEYNTSDKVLDDGEYWLQPNPNNPNTKFKTYCDMVFEQDVSFDVEGKSVDGRFVGGYTLLWSYSEKTNLFIYNGSTHSQNSKRLDVIDDNPKGLFSNKDGVINYNNYRAKNISWQPLTDRVVRVRITSNPKDDNDAYGKLNFMTSSGNLKWFTNVENYPSSVYGRFGYNGTKFEILQNNGWNADIIIDGTQDRKGQLYLNNNYGSHINVTHRYGGIDNMFGYYGDQVLQEYSPFGKCSVLSDRSVNGKTGPGCAANQLNAVHEGVNGDEGYVTQWWVR